MATGELDAFVLIGGGAWDHAAVAAIVEEAGGRFSAADGSPRIDAASAVFTNGRIHEAVLEALRG